MTTTSAVPTNSRLSWLDRPGQVRRISVTLAVWSFLYAGYRAYYALGGSLGMIGEPVSPAQFRGLNAVGAVLIAIFSGILPLAAVRVPILRRALPWLGWIGGVGCCMHALVDTTLRILSLSGVHPTQLPATVWLSFDRRAADLQDVFLNEPWFLITGLLWAALGLAFVRPVRRRGWLISAVVALFALTAVGVLSGLDVIGSFTIE